jgi:hypothetical protein
MNFKYLLVLLITFGSQFSYSQIHTDPGGSGLPGTYRDLVVTQLVCDGVEKKMNEKEKKLLTHANHIYSPNIEENIVHEMERYLTTQLIKKQMHEINKSENYDSPQVECDYKCTEHKQLEELLVKYEKLKVDKEAKSCHGVKGRVLLIEKLKKILE